MPISPDSPPAQDRIWLALRFGWTLAEICGRLAENPPPDTPPASTRLFLSDLNPSPNERLWAAVQRLIYLTHQLFPPEDTQGRGGSQPSEVQPSPASLEVKEEEIKVEQDEGRPLELEPGSTSLAIPGCLNDLLQRLEKRMPGAGKLPKVEDMYRDLNPWSRRIWGRLDAEDPLLAEAATLGARLADTFWQWPYPAGQPPAPGKHTWQHMLKQERLNRLIRSVRTVEAHLPAHVGPMLRHSLWEWSIVGELGRSDSGALEIMFPFWYNLRSLNWARRLRRRRIDEVARPPLEVGLGEDQALWKQLLNQVTTWEHLVFNRPLGHLLRPSDWRQVRRVTLGLYAAMLVAITAGGALLVAGLIWLVSEFLVALLPFLAAPTEFKDQLTLATTIVVVLAFLFTQLRQGLGRLRHLHDGIYQWVMMRKLQQRGLRTWDGQTKPLAWIWLQRLLRAEDA
jgi:hypothetical protein